MRVDGMAMVAAGVGAMLGEGPVWSAADQALWFVDIKGPRVFRLDPATGVVDRWDAPAQVGWVLPAADGGLWAGLATGLHHFDPQGGFTPVVAVEPDLPGNRLNDATVDGRGRLWFGTMHDEEAAPTGHFYRADGRGIARVVGGITITNGPAVSPDGATLYHVDTLAGTIHASDLAADGELHRTRPFAAIDPADGNPDGVSVDAEGGVWVGLFGGWAARRYRPDGALAATVRFPVANVTKVAFGGPGLRTAYATTARLGLAPDALAAQSLAGDLFAFDPGVAGWPVPPVGPIRATRLY